MSHILGFVGRIDEEEYARLKASGYQLDDQLGKTGVEYTYESPLRGTPGAQDRRDGRFRARDPRPSTRSPASAGSSVVLSIDIDLQQQGRRSIVKAAMGKSRNAAAVVIDVRTGEILAMVSLPTYDNNIFTRRASTSSALETLLNDPGKPLVNHAIAEMYPPGSHLQADHRHRRPAGGRRERQTRRSRASARSRSKTSTTPASSTPSRTGPRWAR